MKTFERRQDILALLRERQAVKVTDLAEIFNVSHGTIRSDLNYLSETGQVTRIRGGATAHDQHQIHDPAFAARARMNISAKQNIARWAADMVKDGEAIYLDSGTTTFHMIPFLQDVGESGSNPGSGQTSQPDSYLDRRRRAPWYRLSDRSVK